MCIINIPRQFWSMDGAKHYENICKASKEEKYCVSQYQPHENKQERNIQVIYAHAYEGNLVI